MLSLLQTYISQTLERQLPDVNSLNLDGLPPYQYTPFSDQYSIRLLEIIATSSPQIQCRLKTFALHDAPDYDALSYTWGDPRPPLFQSIGSSHYQKKHLVRCNDRAIYVSTNLHDALQRLRHAQHNSSLQGPALQKYIWIDALCIDQQDLPERSTQVALMEEIYRGAQIVVTWLGNADPYTKPALRLITRLADHPPRQIEQYGTLGQRFPDVSQNDWEALVAFFARSYFRRAWIIQEIVLARKMVGFIGHEMIDWGSLVKASLFLESVNIGDRLNIMRTYFASLSDRMAKKNLSPAEGTIANLSILKGKHSEMYGPRGEITWHTLYAPIHIGRGFLASNERDHFYSVLGIIKNIVMSSSNLDEHALEVLARLPVPDYTKSVSRVFTEFAIWQLEAFQNLSLLFMVEDRSFRSSNLRDCPSWVPDQSATLRPQPLEMISSGLKWDASLSEGIGVHIASSEGDLLLVRGGQFDTITATAGPLQDMTRDAEGWVEVLNLIKPFLRSKYPVTGASYADALWRTLIADSNNPLENPHAPRQSPADKRLAIAFNEWLITRMSFFSGFEGNSKTFEAENYAKATRLLLKAVWDQLYFDPSVLSSSLAQSQQDLSRYEKHERSIYRDRPQKGTFEHEPEKFGAALLEMALLDQSGTFFSSAQIKTTITTLGLKSPNNLLSRLLDRKDAFIAATKNISNDRRLVLTRNGYLALAAISAGVGDQVWILCGPSTPFVLRPLSNGRYMLMGEAYVHGIMHGEAVKAGKVQFEDIELQ